MGLPHHEAGVNSKSVLWRVTRKRRGLEQTNSDLKAATRVVVSRCATIIYMYVYTVHSDSRTRYSTYWHMSSSSKTQVFKDYTNYQCYFRSLWLEGKVAYIYKFVYIYTYMMCVCIYCIYIYCSPSLWIRFAAAGSPRLQHLKIVFF